MVRRLMRGGHALRGLRPERGRRRGAARRRAPPGAAASRTSWQKLAAAARGVGDGARRRTRPRAPSRRSASLLRRATRSSTAATPTSRTTSGARRSSAKKGIHYVDAGTSGGVWGARARLLPDGRRAEGGGDAARADLRTLAPGGRHRAPPRAATAGSTAEEGYLHCGPSGAGPLREDGPQRHRVRPDAGLRRGLRHLQERGLASSCRRTTATTSTSPTSPSSGGAAASCRAGCST